MPHTQLRKLQARSLPPWMAWSTLVVCMAVSEYGLMLALKRWMPSNLNPGTEAVLDAVSLTLLMTPLLWWLLVRPLQQAAAQRDRFLKDLFATIEEERKRIAAELHDGVGQSLSLLISGLRSLTEENRDDLPRRAQDMRQIAQRTLVDVKQLALGLRPSILDDLGLPAAIERVADELRTLNTMTVAVTIDAPCTERLPGPTETALFRILQEAISNAVKYSEASTLEIRLTCIPDGICLEVADNGRGIDPKVLNQPGHLSGHLGLVGLAERAAVLSGKLSIESGIGQGTRITVRVPVKKGPR